MINSDQQRAILSVCLMAAFADGNNDQRERARIEQVFDSLASQQADAAAWPLPAVYQAVLLKQVSLTDLAALLNTDGSRQLAYEMAVHVIDSDGVQTVAEQAFLNELRQALGLSIGQALSLAGPADALAAAAYAPAAAPAPASAVAQPVNEVELDKTILNSAIMNGALELLPQSWATMAIIPLQTRMVYGIGKKYGFELDAGHVKEFLATVGVGLASQYLEQAGRKLIGGLFGKLAGGLVGSLTRGGTGMAFSFASTYALGQLAKRYYGGGRTMSAAVLKDTFSQLLEPARQIQTQYAQQIQAKAGNVNMADVLSLVRGKSSVA